MRSFCLIVISMCSLFGPGTQRALAVASPIGEDSLRSGAIAMVEQTLSMLRYSRDLNPFKNQFSSSAAQHPCDICPKMAALPVEEYAFQVLEHYPDTFAFQYRVDHGHVNVERDNTGIPFRVNVPYSKSFPKPKAGNIGGESKIAVFHLVAKVRVGPDGSYSMETVVQERAPGNPMTFLEGSVGVALGKLTYADSLGLDPKNSGVRGTLGLIRYFNPFSNLNRSNIWLKAGLRFEWSATSLVQQEITYMHNDVALSPAQTPDSSLDQQIDLAWHVHGLEERIKTLSFEIPLGISKRWQLGPRSVFSMDLGVTVGYEVFKDITGRYRLDQHGSDHRIGGQLMGQSNGGPLIYTEPDASVFVQGGERVDFFSDRQYVLDDLVQSKHSTFSFGIAPSMIVRGKRNGSFRIGLDLSMVKRRTANTDALNERYFLSGDDTSRGTLGEMGKGGFRPWLGLVLAVQL